MNPVKAKIVEKAEDYQWSSYKPMLKQDNETLNVESLIRNLSIGIVLAPNRGQHGTCTTISAFKILAN